MITFGEAFIPVLKDMMATIKQVASKIKSEIQSAFRNVPSFSFLDPVEVR